MQPTCGRTEERFLFLTVSRHAEVYSRRGKVILQRQLAWVHATAICMLKNRSSSLVNNEPRSHTKLELRCTAHFAFSESR
jgi:hypothetical protein